MKLLVTFIHKEFLHIFRDSRTMLILIGMPVVMILLFGFAISTEVKNIRIQFYSPQNNQDITKIISHFEANDLFIVGDRIFDPLKINTDMIAGKNDAVVIFDNNFGNEKQLQIEILVDASDPGRANSISSSINAVIVGAISQQSANQLINMHVRMLSNPRGESSYNFVPGIIGMILMLICAMMTSISIVREKETGTMEVLLVSPVKPIYIIIAKLVPYFVLSFVNLASILILSYTILGLPAPTVTSFISLLIFSTVYILLALSLGLLISNIMKTQVSAMLTSAILLLLPTMLLSGMIYPLEDMPAVLQYFAQIIPAKWFIVAARQIMIKQLTLFDVTEETAVLSLMLFAFTAMGLKLFKIRLE